MKTKFIIATLAVIFVLGFNYTLNAQKLKKWVHDPNYSSIIFVISHLNNGRINGLFSDFNIHMENAGADFSNAKLVLTINASSIFTNNPQRDSIIKGIDFLEVEDYPTITFKSDQFEKLSDQLYNVFGDLTMRGVTHPLLMQLEYKGIEWDPEIKEYTPIFLMQCVINGPTWGVKPHTLFNGIWGNYMNMIIDFELLELTE